MFAKRYLYMRCIFSNEYKNKKSEKVKMQNILGGSILQFQYPAYGPVCVSRHNILT